MTLCLTCKRYVMDADSCTADGIRFPDGESLAAVPFGEESADEGADQCPDCGVDRGGYHHPGCDVAECPRCGEPLVSCGCLDE